MNHLSKKNKVTKSVFLYGNPTKVKSEALFNTQVEYTKVINFFIDQLINDKKYFLDVLNNNKHSAQIRALEKDNRFIHDLGSAYGQNAVDDAVTHLHNHFMRIKKNLYGIVKNNEAEILPYISFTSLLNASIMDTDELDILEFLIKRAPKKNKEIYIEVYDQIRVWDANKRSEIKLYVRDLFFDKLENWKTPYIKLAPVQLDSRVSKLEESTNTKEDFVVSIKLLDQTKRIQFPVSTSGNSIRRMQQYKTGSLSVSLVNGKVRFVVPFEKNIKKKEQNELLGVDLGITDLFYTSSKNNYGTFTGMVDQYNEVLQKKLANRSSLNNKKREYQKKLKRSTDSKEKSFLKRKIKNISDNLNGRKSLQKRRRAYNHLVDFEISRAAKCLFEEVKNNNYLPVFEDLEINEFNRGRKANKRDSFWVRGDLIKRVTELLSWNGYKIEFVDPAYTSKACSKCYNLDNNNRKGKTFTCTVCKYTVDADYNAAVNIKNRAFDREFEKITEEFDHNKEKRHKALRKSLKSRHRSALSLAS